MSDLLDAALERWEGWELGDTLRDMGTMDTILEAARKYANLDESIDLDRLSDGLEFAHITDSDAEYLVYVARQVTAALGITEDK